MAVVVTISRSLSSSLSTPLLWSRVFFLSRSSQFFRRCGQQDDINSNRQDVLNKTCILTGAFFPYYCQTKTFLPSLPPDRRPPSPSAASPASCARGAPPLPPDRASCRCHGRDSCPCITQTDTHTLSAFRHNRHSDDSPSRCLHSVIFTSLVY